jgi:hypothetical protein
VTDGDGETQCVRFGTGRGRLDDAAGACRGAVRVDALDRENAVLRSWEPPAPVVAGATPPGGLDSGALVQVARLLNEAGDKAAQRHARAYEMAFEKQAELLGIIVRRLDASERLVAQLLIETVRGDQHAAEPAAPDATDAMAMQLLQGAIMSAASGAAPNGKG